MKKLVLLMVSALVLTIFISFNYLLWFRGEQITDYQDRIKKIEEQQAMKENIANSNNNYYLGQILEKNREIEYLNKEIERLKSDSNRLEQELQLGTTDLKRKSAVINKLKVQSDLEPLKAVITTWIELIDKGMYENAYRLQNNLLDGASMSQEAAKNLSEFTDKYRKNIKNVSVKSIELLSEGFTDDKKGDIVFKVSIDVKKPENSDYNEFLEGINTLYFGMTVDQSGNRWIISSIADQIN